jgi:hypothetical protein
MALAKGPFDVQWGSTLLAGVESLDVSYDVASEEKSTIQGTTYTLYGAHKVTVEITLLDTDVPSLKAVLPQYGVNNGATLSTGETVSNVAGAIDLVPGGCTSVAPMKSLIVTSCGAPGEVFRVVDASTEISGIDIDSVLRTVKVKFTGNAPTGQATVQFYGEGAVAGVS